jgi:hypothetical protein
MQGLLDGYQSMGHMFIAFNCEALFNAFIVTALLQFVACVMFEMAFLQHLYKTAFPAEFEGGWEANQRARKIINLKFYSWMMFGLAFFYIVPSGFEVAHFVLYGFWVPQIVWQAVHGFRRGFGVRYIVAMSSTRLVLPLYFLACPVNFLNHQVDLVALGVLLAWVGGQLCVLHAQQRLGARFFVPKRFLPQQYDYHRSIPLLRLGRRARPDPEAPPPEGDLSLAGLSAALEDGLKESVSVEIQERVGLLAADAADSAASDATALDAATQPHVAIAISSTAASSSSSSVAPSSTSTSASAVPATPEDENPCPICYTELDPDVARSIMVCPCDHLFHTGCLKKWMKQKNECPVCRAELPVIEEQDSDPEDEEEKEDEYEDGPIEHQGEQR